MILCKSSIKSTSVNFAWFFHLLPSSVPVGNCNCNWTELALLPHSYMWEKPVGWDKVDMIFRLSHPATHPPDRLDFFGTQFFFQDPNFNPNPIPTQLQPNPIPNPTPTEPIVKLECGSANPACFSIGFIKDSICLPSCSSLYTHWSRWIACATHVYC